MKYTDQELLNKTFSVVKSVRTLDHAETALTYVKLVRRKLRSTPSMIVADNLTRAIHSCYNVINRRNMK